MTKELLLSELIKNDEFNGINNPIKLSRILGKPAYIIDKVIVDHTNVYTGDQIDCQYLTIDKEYTLNLFNTQHDMEFVGCTIFCEGYNGSYGFSISEDYDQDDDCLKLTLHDMEASEEGGTPLPCYLTLDIEFYHVK